jgi:hypothetical protein
MNGIPTQDGATPGADLPPLPLQIRPPGPRAWDGIVRRARRRRRRTVAASALAVVLAAGVPVTLAVPESREAPPVAHRSADQHSDLCASPYDQPPPVGDRIETPFRARGLLVSTPPADATPAVSQKALLERTKARGTPVHPGTQLRYGVVRRVYPDGRLGQPLLRWILTTCGLPGQERIQPATPPTAPPAERPKTVAVQQDQVALLTDSGATTDSNFGRGFDGICATRLQDRAPEEQVVNGSLAIGELRAVQPPDGATLAGRERVVADVRARQALFPGTQIRLALTSPLHAPGPPTLHWLVTTCGLDGTSVRPALPGVVSEALVYDGRGRLRETHRGSQLNAALTALARTSTPESIPTYTSAHPNMCGPWSQAYPDFKNKASAAGYTDMQGCYRQAESTVVFVSSPTRGAAAAVFTATGKAYQDVYAARFPFSAFTLLPAPKGATRATLLRLLSPTVAEVRLSGPNLSPTSYKFDAQNRAWQECSDQTGTRAPCSG